MNYIQSKQNEQLKAWKKLLTSKGRQQTQTYIIEGSHLAEEALKFGQDIRQWIMTESYYQKFQEEPFFQVDTSSLVIIRDNLATELSATKSPQGIFAVLALLRSVEASELSGRRYLLLDQIQDPGNLGTLIRTADAAAYSGVIIGNGSVDLYNDKVIRSTQGSLWHLPIYQGDLSEIIQQLQSQQVQVYASALDASSLAYQDVAIPDKLALIVGNEGQGVQNNLLKLADQIIHIPMPGQAESLNVAIAAAILMFTYI